MKNICSIWGKDPAAESAMCKLHWNDETGQFMENTACFRPDLSYLICVHKLPADELYRGFPEYHQLAIVVFTWNKPKKIDQSTTVQLFCPHGIGPNETNTRAAASIFPYQGVWNDVRDELMALDERTLQEFGIDVCQHLFVCFGYFDL